MSTKSDSNIKRLKQLLTSGSVSMQEKLCTYAQNHLPGGKYWSPEEPVKKILSSLKPSNDLCVSFLGLNDYLTKAIPNLHQVARSSLVEVKKNKTMQWLHQLPDEQQAKVIDLAVVSRQRLHEEYKHEEERARERQQRMKEEHVKRETAKHKDLEEQRKLSQLHLITSVDELCEVLKNIDHKQLSISKKESEKLSIIKTQINIRKKVLGKSIKIKYSSSRKKRPRNY